VDYSAVDWRSFGEALAGVSGALTGLLFVAVSIKSDILGRSRNLSARAAQALVLFLIPVVVSLLLVAPQPPDALGPELVAVAVIAGAILVIFDQRAGGDTGGRIRDPGGRQRGDFAGRNRDRLPRPSREDLDLVTLYLNRFAPNAFSPLLTLVAGVSFIVTAGGGLYWLIPAMATALVGGVITAWLFLVKVTDHTAGQSPGAPGAAG
jgi:hypothetical protein